MHLLTCALRFSTLVNVFQGILNNHLFCSILVGTSILQAIIVQFGSVAFHVVEGGLDAKYWAVSLGFGAGSLPIQQCINLLYRAAKHYKGLRMKRRLARNRNLMTRTSSGRHHHAHDHHDHEE